MDITRRKFFFFGLAAGIGLLLPDSKINPFEYPWIYKPTQKQIDFFNTPPNVPMSLYGIPYHQSNVDTGTWLGFDRSKF